MLQANGAPLLSAARLGLGRHKLFVACIYLVLFLLQCCRASAHPVIMVEGIGSTNLTMLPYANCELVAHRLSCSTVADAVNAILLARRNADNPKGPARLLLQPTQDSKCTVPLASGNEEVHLSESTGAVDIKTEPNQYCSHSVLTRRNGTAPFFRIHNATQVLLQGLEFSLPLGVAAIAMHNSRLVRIDRCRFLIPGVWKKMDTVSIENSHAVFFTRCQMERQKEVPKPYLTHPGELKQFKSFIVVVDNVTRHLTVVTRLSDYQHWLTENGTDAAMILALQTAQEYHSSESTCSSSATCYIRFIVAILDCQFHDVGVTSPEDSQLEFSVHYLKGSALHIDVSPCSQPSLVFIHNSTFSELSSPEGSPVYIHIRNTTSGKNKRKPVIVRRHVIISKCHFSNNKALLGGAICIRFSSKARGATVGIIQSKFLSNYARQGGGAIHVRFSNLGRNCVWMDNVEFHHNTVRSNTHVMGAAVLLFKELSYGGRDVKCYSEPFRHQVNIANGKFSNNTGFGTVFSRSISVGFYNSTSIINSVGTGLVVMHANATFEGRVEIERNVGHNGGGIHVGDFGNVDFSEVTAFRVVNNTASQKGGAIYIDLYSSVPTIGTLRAYIGTDRFLASCPVRLPTRFMKTAGPMLTSNNRDPNATADRVVPAIYSGSWNKCFKSYGILDEHIAEDSNYCAPYPPAEWSYVKSRSYSKAACSAKEPYSLSGIESFVPGEGNDFLSIRPRPCHTVCQNFTIVSELGMFREKIRTLPAWILFNSATTACYKRVHGKVWFFRQDCSREAILTFALNNSASQGQLQRFDCPLYYLAVIHERYRTSLTPILPGYPLLLTPWSSLVHDWLDYTLESFSGNASAREALYNESCDPVTNKRISSEMVMGDITLNPAPGEEFDLALDVVDEFFTVIRATLMVEVVSTDHNVMLRLDGRDYGPNQRIFYSSSGNLRGISLSGVPGTTGKLKINLIGSMAIRFAVSREFDILIPFKLRPCFPGFTNPEIMDREEAANYVREHRLDAHAYDINSKDVKSFYDKTDRSKLVCRCPDLDGIRGCRLGRDIIVQGGYWAGNFSYVQYRQLDTACVYDKAEFLMKNRTYLSNDSCNAQGIHDFVVGVCTNGLCRKESNGKWVLSSDNPCRERFKRTGPLCGSCMDGYHVVISSEICYQCSFTISIVLYFILVFICSALLFTAALVLNIGVSPVLNSWLFFIQAVFIIFADHVSIRNIFYAVMTFGWGYFCTVEQLSPLQARAAILAQPMFIFLFSFLIWLAVKKGFFARRLQHLQRRNSLAHVIWLSVIWYTATVAYIATFLLNSITLDTATGSRKVLFLDSSVELFSSEHTPYGVMAILLLLIFVLPAPIVMAVPSLRSLPQFKWYTDEAMTLYEPECHWWAAVDLARRLVLSCMQGFISNGRIRQYSISLMCMLFLALHITFRPLKRNKRVWKIRDIDNKFETLLLFDLCILTLAKIGGSCIGSARAIIDMSSHSALVVALYSLPTVLSVLITVVRFTKSIQYMFGKPRPSRRYVMDDCDQENEVALSLTELRCGKPDGCSSPSPSPVANARIGALRDLPLSAQSRQMNVLPMADGLRDPLLIEHLLGPDPKLNSQNSN